MNSGRKSYWWTRTPVKKSIKTKQTFSVSKEKSSQSANILFVNKDSGKVNPDWKKFG